MGHKQNEVHKQIVKFIKQLEPDYDDVANFDELTVAELKELYVKLIKDKKI